MGLKERAQELNKRFTSDSSTFFAESADFTAPTGETATVNVLHTKHHTAYSAEGEMVNVLVASIAVNEEILTDDGYPTRDASNEVTFSDHRVSIKDSSQVVKEYICDEWYPDEYLGMIVLILKYYSA